MNENKIIPSNINTLSFKSDDPELICSQEQRGPENSMHNSNSNCNNSGNLNVEQCESSSQEKDRNQDEFLLDPNTTTTASSPNNVGVVTNSAAVTNQVTVAPIKSEVKTSDFAPG